MIKPFFGPAFSRRTALAGLGMGTLALAMQQLAYAQEATPEVEVFARINHSINGAWHWNDLAAEVQSTGIFSPDGTYLEYHLESGVGIGFWRPITEDTGELVVNFQRLGGDFLSLEGPSAMFEIGYVPEVHEFRLDGVLTFRQNLRLDPSGTSMTGSGIFQVWQQGAPVLSSIHSDTFGRKGNRLIVAREQA